MSKTEPKDGPKINLPLNEAKSEGRCEARPDKMASNLSVDRKPRARRYKRGDLVEVRQPSEILATLDAEQKLDGLPFTREMARYCGRRFHVYRRVGKVYLDKHHYVARIADTVLLVNAYCNGNMHDKCQMGCLLLWKEAWLKPAHETDELESANADQRSLQVLSSGVIVGRSGCPDAEEATPGLGAVLGSNGESKNNPPMGVEFKSCCQAVYIANASRPVAPWDVRQYMQDCFGGERSLIELMRMAFRVVVNRVRWQFGRRPLGTLRGAAGHTPEVHLNLQPGEFATVKSRAEIQATLDSDSRNRGLAFAPDMLRFCGKTFRVAKRVERLVVEWSGELREIRNTVALEGATCSGIDQRCCPRNCNHLWREAWLERVEAAEPATTVKN